MARQKSGSHIIEGIIKRNYEIFIFKEKQDKTDAKVVKTKLL